MKKSVILAFLILIAAVGWLGSGQITNVNAQDEKKSDSPKNNETTDNEIIDSSSEIEEVVFYSDL